MQGQLAVEIMIVFGILIVLLTVVIIFGFQKNQQVIHGQLDSRAEDAARYVASKINTVYMEGTGFETTVTIPDKIEGFNFTAYVANNTLVLWLQGNSYIQILLTNNVSGSLSPGTHTVRNVNNGVVIL